MPHAIDLRTTFLGMPIGAVLYVAETDRDNVYHKVDQDTVYNEVIAPGLYMVSYCQITKVSTWYEGVEFTERLDLLNYNVKNLCVCSLVDLLTRGCKCGGI